MFLITCCARTRTAIKCALWTTASSQIRCRLFHIVQMHISVPKHQPDGAVFLTEATVICGASMTSLSKLARFSFFFLPFTK